MSGPDIEITTEDGFTPSDDLRAALERLASAAEADGLRIGAPEVAGFGRGLNVGSVDIRGGQTSGWRDGCWGFKEGPGGGCNWFQDSNDVPPTHCIGHSW
jgi:hypothetical protein